MNPSNLTYPDGYAEPDDLEAARRAINRPAPPDGHARERYTEPGRAGQLGVGYRRDYPARYDALAAELAHRDGVRSVRSTATSVVVRGDVPAWYRRKAELAGVPLTVREGSA